MQFWIYFQTSEGFKMYYRWQPYLTQVLLQTLETPTYYYHFISKEVGEQRLQALLTYPEPVLSMFVKWVKFLFDSPPRPFDP